MTKTKVKTTGSWTIGFGLNIFGSFCINFGTNLIQYSHVAGPDNVSSKLKNNKKRIRIKTKKISKTKSKIYFIIGWILFIIGNLFNFISFSYASQTLLSSLGSVQFISNLLCAFILFNKIPNIIQYIGTLSIIIGNISIVIVANKSVQSYDSDTLIKEYTRDGFIIYMGIIGVLTVIFQIIYIYYYRKDINNNNNNNNINGNISDDNYKTILNSGGNSDINGSNDDSNDVNSVITDALSKILQTNIKLDFILPFCYAIVSGMIGSQSVMYAKSFSLMVTESFTGNNQFGSAYTYIFLILYIITIIFWLYRMNNALICYDGVFIIPLLQVLWMLFSILSGGILFMEFHGYSVLKYIIFTIGVIIIFIGVYLLSPVASSSINSTNNNNKPSKLNNKDNDPYKFTVKISDYNPENNSISGIYNDAFDDTVHSNMNTHTPPTYSNKHESIKNGYNNDNIYPDDSIHINNESSVISH